MDKKWGLLVHLGGELNKNMLARTVFDMDMWNEYVDHCEKCGVNFIVLEVGGSVQWESHPEIVVPGAWSKEFVKSEILRLREKGIEVVPHINFSTTHSMWLGEVYSRMVSTPEYYKLTKDLIEEVYEMFLHPSIIHVGMDEENWKHAIYDGFRDVIMFRGSPLQVNDLNYFVECVESLGAKCHIWHDPYNNVNPEDKVRIKDSVIPEIWMYYSYLKEKWTPVSEQDDHVRNWYKTEFVRRYGYEVEYIEESPAVLASMKLLDEFFTEKRHFMMATSNLYIKNCECDAVEFVRRNNPDFSLFDGMVGTTWSEFVPENRELWWEEAELIGKARKIAEEAMGKC